MSVSLSQLVTWVGMFVGLIGIWYRNQFKIERLEEKHTEHSEEDDSKHIELIRQKDALWKWIQEHEKEANDMREKFNRELSEMRGGMLVTGEQFKQVLNLLTDIKERLTRLETLR